MALDSQRLQKLLQPVQQDCCLLFFVCLFAFCLFCLFCFFALHGQLAASSFSRRFSRAFFLFVCLFVCTAGTAAQQHSNCIHSFSSLSNRLMFLFLFVCLQVCTGQAGRGQQKASCRFSCLVDSGLATIMASPKTLRWPKHLDVLLSIYSKVSRVLGC